MASQRGEFTAANVYLQTIIFFQATHQHLDLAEVLNDAEVNPTRDTQGPRCSVSAGCMGTARGQPQTVPEGAGGGA